MSTNFYLNRQQLESLLVRLGAVKKGARWSCVFCGGKSCVNILDGSGGGAVAHCHRKGSSRCEKSYGGYALHQSGLISGLLPRNTHAPQIPAPTTSDKASKGGWLDLSRLWNLARPDHGEDRAVEYLTLRAWNDSDAHTAVSTAQFMGDLIGRTTSKVLPSQIHNGTAPEWAHIPSQCWYQDTLNQPPWAFMAAIRDEKGEIHSAEKRRHHPDKKRRKTALPSKLLKNPAPAGTPRAFGSIPSVMGGGSSTPVVIVEGLTDYLSALACSTLDLHLRFGVLGACGAEQLPKIGAAMLRYPSEYRRRVVLVPHKDTHGKGQEKMEALSAVLRPFFDVKIADVGDLNDLTDHVEQRGGLTSALKILRIPLTSPKIRGLKKDEGDDPLDIGDSKAILGEVERLMRGASPDEVAVISMPTGAGKTYGALSGARHLIGEGQTVVFALQNHALIAEKAEEARRLGLNLQVVQTWRTPGACELLNDIESKEGRERREVAERMMQKRGSPCRGCSLASGCPASPQARQQGIVKGGLTLVTHAYALSGVEYPKGTLLIFDESPTDITSGYHSIEELTSLSTAGDPYAKGHPDMADLADQLASLVMEQAREALKGTPQRSKQHGITVEVNAEEARSIPSAVEVAKYNPIFDLPRAPSEEDIRSWTEKAVGPSREAARSLIELCRGTSTLSVLARQTGEKLELRDVEVRVDRRAAWPGCAVMILDATAEQTMGEHEARAVHWGKTLNFKRIEVVGLEAEVEWIQTGAYQRRSLLSGVRVRRRGVRSLMRTFQGEGRKTSSNPSVGVIAPKLVSGLLKAVVEGDRAEIRRRCSADVRESDIQILRSALKKLGRPVIGHWGADNRASNAFQAVDQLILISAPIPNLAAIRADATVLGLDADELIRGRVASEVEQAVGRIRAIRRGGRVVLYAPGPRGAVPELDKAINGCRWDIDASEKRGRPFMVEARELAEGMANTFGGISADWLLKEGLKERTAQRVASEVAKARGWASHHIGKGRLWGPNQLEATAAKMAYMKGTAALVPLADSEKGTKKSIDTILAADSLEASPLWEKPSSIFFSSPSSFLRGAQLPPEVDCRGGG